MPAYNSAATIVRAIESVRAQTMPRWALTIVDDGSTDTTSETVRAYLRANNTVSNIRLESLAKNVGVAEARNVGISQSDGEWIVFFDADDEMVPTHLDRLLAEAIGDIDIVICGRTVVLPTGAEYAAHSPALGTFSGAEAARLTMADKLTPFPWDRLIRRSLFQGVGFPRGAVRCEDSMTNIVLCARARQVSSIPDSGIRYHVSGGSITWGKIYTMADTEIAWDFMIANIPTHMTHGKFATALGCARASVALVIAHTAVMRQDKTAPRDRQVAVRTALAESRQQIQWRDVSRALRANRKIGVAALLFKAVPGIYAMLYRRYVASTYAVEG
jgi:GT2 family glycosyltransferase